MKWSKPAAAQPIVISDHNGVYSNHYPIVTPLHSNHFLLLDKYIRNGIDLLLCNPLLIVIIMECMATINPL